MTPNLTHNLTSLTRAEAPSLGMAKCVPFVIEQGKGYDLDRPDPGSKWESTSA